LAAEDIQGIGLGQQFRETHAGTRRVERLIADLFIRRSDEFG
jgi:hypothetical protein